MSGTVKSDDTTKVVYIDDHIEEAGQLENVFTRFKKIDLSIASWPDSLEQAIDDADVIITDLKLEHMARTRPLLSIDGQALNELIRAGRRKNQNHPLYAIFSGNLDEVPNPEHHAGRPHILAQSLDVDLGRGQGQGWRLQRPTFASLRCSKETQGKPVRSIEDL